MRWLIVNNSNFLDNFLEDQNFRVIFSLYIWIKKLHDSWSQTSIKSPEIKNYEYIKFIMTFFCLIACRLQDCLFLSAFKIVLNFLDKFLLLSYKLNLKHKSTIILSKLNLIFRRKKSNIILSFCIAYKTNNQLNPFFIYPKFITPC